MCAVSGVITTTIKIQTIFVTSEGALVCFAASPPAPSPGTHCLLSVT